MLCENVEATRRGYPRVGTNCSPRQKGGTREASYSTVLYKTRQDMGWPDRLSGLTSHRVRVGSVQSSSVQCSQPTQSLLQRHEPSSSSSSRTRTVLRVQGCTLLGSTCRVQQSPVLYFSFRNTKHLYVCTGCHERLATQAGLEPQHLRTCTEYDVRGATLAPGGPPPHPPPLVMGP